MKELWLSNPVISVIGTLLQVMKVIKNKDLLDKNHVKVVILKKFMTMKTLLFQICKEKYKFQEEIGKMQFTKLHYFKIKDQMLKLKNKNKTLKMKKKLTGTFLLIKLWNHFPQEIHNNRLKLLFLKKKVIFIPQMAQNLT